MFSQRKHFSYSYSLLPYLQLLLVVFWSQVTNRILGSQRKTGIRSIGKTRFKRTEIPLRPTRDNLIFFPELTHNPEKAEGLTVFDTVIYIPMEFYDIYFFGFSYWKTRDARRQKEVYSDTIKELKHEIFNNSNILHKTENNTYTKYIIIIKKNNNNKNSLSSELREAFLFNKERGALF